MDAIVCGNASPLPEILEPSWPVTSLESRAEVAWAWGVGCAAWSLLRTYFIRRLFDRGSQSRRRSMAESCAVRALSSGLQATSASPGSLSLPSDPPPRRRRQSFPRAPSGPWPGAMRSAVPLPALRQDVLGHTFGPDKRIAKNQLAVAESGFCESWKIWVQGRALVAARAIARSLPPFTSGIESAGMATNSLTRPAIKSRSAAHRLYKGR